MNDSDPVRLDVFREADAGELLPMCWAKSGSHGHLCLYTFARNARARAFYEKHGFRAVAHGFEPTWHLDDVRYEWTRPSG